MAKIVSLKGKKIFTLHNVTCVLWLLTGVMVLASGVYGVFMFADNYQYVSAVFILCGIMIFLWAYLSITGTMEHTDIRTIVPKTPAPPSKSDIAEANYLKFVAAYDELNVQDMTDNILRRYHDIATNAEIEANEEMYKRNIR